MENLDVLNKKANEYHLKHYNNGGASEFDMSINDISRQKIKAFKKQFGKCFLYKINIYRHEEINICTEYTEQKIYNFSADFCLSSKDETIIQMLEEHNKPKEKFSSKITMDNIEKIYDRVIVLKGILLSWV